MAAITVDGKVNGFGLFCAGTIGMARAESNDSANSQFFLMADPHHMAVSSNLVKVIARMGGDVTPFVTSGVVKDLMKKVNPA